MKDRRRIEFDGIWMTVNPVGGELARLGYAVGANKKDGRITYSLHQLPDRAINNVNCPVIAEFDTPEELNNMIKLLLAPNDEG